MTGTTRLQPYVFHLIAASGLQHRTVTFYGATEGEARRYAVAWCELMGWRIEA